MLSLKQISFDRERIKKIVFLIILSMACYFTTTLAHGSSTSEKIKTSIFDEAILKVAKQGVKIKLISVDQKQSTALIVAEDKNHTMFTYDYDLLTKILIGRPSPPISIVNQEQINQSVNNMERLIALAQKNGRHLSSAQNDGDSGMYVSISEQGAISTGKLLF